MVTADVVSGANALVKEELSDGCAALVAACQSYEEGNRSHAAAYKQNGSPDVSKTSVHLSLFYLTWFKQHCWHNVRNLNDFLSDSQMLSI